MPWRTSRLWGSLFPVPYFHHPSDTPFHRVVDFNSTYIHKRRCVRCQERETLLRPRELIGFDIWMRRSLARAACPSKSLTLSSVRDAFRTATHAEAMAGCLGHSTFVSGSVITNTSSCALFLQVNVAVIQIQYAYFRIWTVELQTSAAHHDSLTTAELQHMIFFQLHFADTQEGKGKPF